MASPSKTPRQNLEVSYDPLVEKAGNENPEEMWATGPDCLDGCIYTVWDSADDYNKVARHVGTPHTDCCTIYCSRAFGLCGGICILNSMAGELKLRYEAVHNLKHQDIPAWAWCCPEITWRQNLRDHNLRIGGPMEPAKLSMAR